VNIAKLWLETQSKHHQSLHKLIFGDNIYISSHISNAIGDHK